MGSAEVQRFLWSIAMALAKEMVVELMFEPERLKSSPASHLGEPAIHRATQEQSA